MSAAIETREIVVDEVLPHKPEIIWNTLTAPELMGRWLKMQPTGFEAVVGNRFTYQTTPAPAWDGVIRCEVLEVTGAAPDPKWVAVSDAGEAAFRKDEG